VTISQGEDFGDAQVGVSRDGCAGSPTRGEVGLDFSIAQHLQQPNAVYGTGGTTYSNNDTPAGGHALSFEVRSLYPEQHLSRNAATGHPMPS